VTRFAVLHPGASNEEKERSKLSILVPSPVSKTCKTNTRRPDTDGFAHDQ
jgi:hypothetical protein